MVRKLFIFILLTVTGTGLMAQLETSADYRRQVYEKEVTFGLIGHSRGYTINSRILKFTDGFNKRGIELELAKLRHPKEVKTPSPYVSSSRGYVFNRINSLFALRVGYIRDHIMFDKTDQGTVAISLITSGGLSLGLVKPIYIQYYDDPPGNKIVTERYNPPVHNGSYLSGEANFFRGIWETKLKPGLYVKVGTSFDYQLIEKKVTALEVGIIYDRFIFPQIGVSGDTFDSPVPVFYQDAEEDNINYTGFFQMYIAINFGYRKN